MKTTCLLGLGWLAAGATAQAQYSYSSFNDPLGINGTTANGIDGHNIVGYYTDGSSINHGFLYNGSSYTSFSDPLGANTMAYGISGSSIVGVYTTSGGVAHGFQYVGGSFTTIDDPLGGMALR